ncbi:cytochrome [Brevibacillus choshinensis]|uniref:Cytochrome n=1 Tax=Brevibacillus choshinensis TaxID=54911 RepID=A0ABR5NF96_BRECH|nr:cytochrome P450 [Brevibacillus choshinensis]KQL50215.1 cytochrome [Brevibacillus choshinensis]
MRELARIDEQLFPFPIYRELREKTPVRFDEDRGSWDVFRYEDVHRILKDPATFSSRRGLEVRGETLLTMDQPKHTHMRNLVNKAFTPKAINDLAPRITSITNELLDQVIQNGKMDVVHDLATPLPVIVIAELLGVPSKDRMLFKDWSDTMVKGVEGNSEEAFAQMVAERDKAEKELAEYFLTILNERRNKPEDDLVSALLVAEIDGEKLQEQEILRFCILLLVAGNETTTNLITNAIRLMTEQPAIQDQVRQHPEYVKTTVEETLRYYPPIVAIGRIATQDVEIGGQLIREGQQVVSWVGSANRDPEKFENPDTFLPDRKPNPHMGFGFGIHFCLGAPLARLEAQIALEIMLSRFSDMQFAKAPLTPIPSPFVFGVKNYPITFTART